VTIKLQSCAPDLDRTQCELLIEGLGGCQLFAEQVAQHASTPLAIALSGTLGAGKTQWTRFFAIALGAEPESVSSPTFMLVHEYASQPPIYHLDAYRIGDEEEMLELGFEEMLDAEAITIVEWADRFPKLLPKNTLRIHIDVGEQADSRIVQLQADGQRAKAILEKLILHWIKE
jgi:tRNA threonylcarbamoyladenosine biosynthesis protein TsaE